MDPVDRVHEHFRESIATKETAAKQIAESIAEAGREGGPHADPSRDGRAG